MVKSLYQYQFLLLFYSVFCDISKQPQLIGHNVRYFLTMGKNVDTFLRKSPKLEFQRNC